MLENKPRPVLTYQRIHLLNDHTAVSYAMVYAHGDEFKTLRSILKQLESLLHPSSSEGSQ